MTNTETEEKLLTGPESQTFLPEDNLPKLNAKEFLIKTSASDLRNIFGIETTTPVSKIVPKPPSTVPQNIPTRTETILPELKPKSENSQKIISGNFPKKVKRFSFFKVFIILLLFALIVLDFLYIWGALIQ